MSIRCDECGHCAHFGHSKTCSRYVNAGIDVATVAAVVSVNEAIREFLAEHKRQALKAIESMNKIRSKELRSYQEGTWHYWQHVLGAIKWMESHL